MGELDWLTDAVESGDIQPGFVCMVLKRLHERDTEIERLREENHGLKKRIFVLQSGGKTMKTVEEEIDQWIAEESRDE